VRKSTCSVVDRALEREPERRYRSVRAFIEALERSHASAPAATEETQELLVDPILRRGRTTTEPVAAAAPRPAVQPMRSMVAAAAVCAVAVLGLLGAARQVRHGAALDVEPRVAPSIEPSRPVELLVTGTGPATVDSPHADSTLRSGSEIAPVPAMPQRPQMPAKPALSRTPASSTPSTVRTSRHAGPEYERRTGLPLATEW